VGVRMPGHPVLQALCSLIQFVGLPLQVVVAGEVTGQRWAIKVHRGWC